MTRVLALWLGGLLLAAPAGATTYYLSNSGSDSGAGTQAAPWATLAKANSSVAAGDVVVMNPGTYAGFPAPAVNGTASQRITYVGSLANPGTVIVTGTSNTIGASYLSIKGMYLLYGFSLTGQRDSLAYCRSGGTNSGIVGADDCVLANCTISAERFWILGEASDTTGKARRDTLQDCSVVLYTTSGVDHTMRWKAVDSLYVNRCRFNITVGPNVAGGGITKMFYVRQSKIVDSYWDATNLNTTGCDECGWMLLRDMSNRNAFVRDTIILRGPGPVQFLPNMSGTYPGTVFSNTYDHCLIMNIGTSQVGAAVYQEDAVNGDTYRYCTIVGQERGIKNANGTANFTMDHCTVVGFSPTRGVWNDNDISGHTWTGTNVITNNIFASLSGLHRAAGTSGMDAVHPAVCWLRTAVAGHITGDHNLFWTAMGADSAIMSTNYDWSAPGAGEPWNLATGADGNSIFGNPQFANVSSITSFSPLLQAGSPARGAGTDGSDIGAHPFTGAGDATPPGTVADLAGTIVDSTRVTLTWTAAGDDGTSGTAALCDVRRSTSAITAANFAAATAVSPSPTPLAGGTATSFTVSGLTPRTTYYFALRTMDDAGNLSDVSNVVVVTTPGTDMTPPARINDLRFP